MEASTTIMRFGSCCTTVSGSRSASSLHGWSESNFVADGRRELATQVKLALSTKRSRSVYRCLYSPLVESYVEPQSKSVVTRLDSNNGQKILVSPSGSGRGVQETEAILEQDVVKVEALSPNEGLDRTERIPEEGSTPAPEDVAAAGDASVLASASDGGHDFEVRRSARYKQPQIMSLTQTFRATPTPTQGNVGIAGGPAAKAGKIGGPAGIFVGLAVAGLGIVTAIQKAGETPQKFCPRCDGYGVECCDVCDGSGKIVWEGKAHRTNLCPRCFGSCLKKCPRCDGTRAKKESTPVLQQLKVPSKSPTKTVPKKS